MANLDFDPNAYNKPRNVQPFAKSGAKAGVEDGLAFVDALDPGVPQMEQVFEGGAQRKPFVTASAGTKEGRSFTFTD